MPEKEEGSVFEASGAPRRAGMVVDEDMEVKRENGTWVKASFSLCNKCQPWMS